MFGIILTLSFSDPVVPSFTIKLTFKIPYWVLDLTVCFVPQHHGTIQQYMGTLENLLFTAELDHHILAVYQQFCALQL